jgi:hypothetical protein
MLPFKSLRDRVLYGIYCNVADSGCSSWIPDPNFSSRIQDLKDSGSQKRIQAFLALKTVSKLSEKLSGMFIPDPDLNFFLIPDPDWQHCLGLSQPVLINKSGWELSYTIVVNPLFENTVSPLF